MFLSGWLRRSTTVLGRYRMSTNKEKGIQQLLKINVDITSDVACPWCWVGKRHLDLAIKKLENDFSFRIRWLPFALNPYLPEEGMLFKDYATMKFGEGAVERFTSKKMAFAQTGEAVGLEFNYSADRRVVPTRKAHILLDYALKEGKQHELHEKLFEANFRASADISDDTVLTQLLQEAGIDNVESALASLTDQQYIKEYEEGLTVAKRKGINGVPYFEIYLADNPDIKQQFSGAQPIDTFVSVFNRLRLVAKV